MIAVIADDITGAAEIAGVCLRRGVSVRMLLGVPEPEALTGAEVLVLAGNSRSGSRQQAVALMEALAVRLRAAGITQVFKKTDSALRGWVLAEMGTLARELGRSRLLIQPANLETGRTIQNGIYYVRGIPIADTAFRDDPAFPAFCSEAAALARARDARSQPGVTGTQPGVTGTEPGVTETQPFVIPDARTAEDMARSAAQCGPEDLPGGSACFWMYYLDAQIARRRVAAGARQAPAPAGLDLSGSLVICGSAHPASHAWCRHLSSRGYPTLEIPEALCLTAEDGSPLAREWARLCIDRWNATGCLLIRSAQKPLSLPDDPGRPGRRLAECTAQLLEATRPARVLIEGGESAWEILRRLGWTRFTPLFEWSPGVVSLRLDSPYPCNITLKPGSYAWPPTKQLS